MNLFILFGILFAIYKAINVPNNYGWGYVSIDSKFRFFFCFVLFTTVEFRPFDSYKINNNLLSLIILVEDTSLLKTKNLIEMSWSERHVKTVRQIVSENFLGFRSAADKSLTKPNNNFFCYKIFYESNYLFIYSIMNAVNHLLLHVSTLSPSLRQYFGPTFTIETLVNRFGKNALPNYCAISGV